MEQLEMGPVITDMPSETVSLRAIVNIAKKFPLT